MISVANPQAQVVALRDEINTAIAAVLDSGIYILGPKVQQFEREFAAFIGAPFAVGVANGTDAVRLALMALGIEAGDEVITVSHSAVATVCAITETGACPVMVDISSSHYCIDVAAIEAAITPKTRAIVPVHIYGQPADMPAIMALAERYDLKVVEDCAQAHGAAIGLQKVGTFGHAAAFSFYPTKNLGALGDGGAVVCKDAAVFDRLQCLRQYGWKTRYISDSHGVNSRLDELQAAVLSVKLKYLESGNGLRRAIAGRYSEALHHSGIIVPKIREGETHAMHLYVVQSEARTELASHLASYGVATALHYPAAIHQQAAYGQKTALPHTEHLYQRLLSLPMYPELGDAEIDQVCLGLKAWNKE
jgi:dTDP-4-amino-4,6-dideoxygalactose transaminase